MPTDFGQLEDTLRAAYSEAAATVRPDEISGHSPAATSAAWSPFDAAAGRSEGITPHVVTRRREAPIDDATGTVGKPIDITAGLDSIVFSP
jgi:hypothetical protein